MKDMGCNVLGLLMLVSSCDPWRFQSVTVTIRLVTKELEEQCWRESQKQQQSMKIKLLPGRDKQPWSILKQQMHHLPRLLGGFRGLFIPTPSPFPAPQKPIGKRLGIYHTHSKEYCIMNKMTDTGVEVCHGRPTTVISDRDAKGRYDEFPLQWPPLEQGWSRTDG